MSEQDLDLALVKRVQQGDKNAFNLLVRKYQNKIAGLIVAGSGGSQAVPNVSQRISLP